MDFDSHAGGETQESKINVYNVVLSYVIEMNEYRSQLYTNVLMTGVTPAPFKDFIRTFFKLFTFTQSMLPEELRTEIDTYFKNNPQKRDAKGSDGITLSLKMQKELENQRMITLYEESIVPPFVDPEEVDGIPEILKKTPPVVKRSAVNPSASAVKSLFSKGSKK